MWPMVRLRRKLLKGGTALDFRRRHLPTVSDMLKKPKVVPINEDGRKLVAECERSKRFILNVGTDRVAFDWSMRATKLPPKTGDQPAPVLPMKPDSKKKRTNLIAAKINAKPGQMLPIKTKSAEKQL
jgi:hypothetical protein